MRGGRGGAAWATSCVLPPRPVFFLSLLFFILSFFSFCSLSIISAFSSLLFLCLFFSPFSVFFFSSSSLLLCLSSLLFAFLILSLFLFIYLPLFSLFSFPIFLINFLFFLQFSPLHICISSSFFLPPFRILHDIRFFSLLLSSLPLLYSYFHIQFILAIITLPSCLFPFSDPLSSSFMPLFVLFRMPASDSSVER